MSTGYAVLMDINGKKADFSKMPKGFKTPKLSICRSISARKSQLIQAMGNITPENPRSKDYGFSGC